MICFLERWKEEGLVKDDDVKYGNLFTSLKTYRSFYKDEKGKKIFSKKGMEAYCSHFSF